MLSSNDFSSPTNTSTRNSTVSTPMCNFVRPASSNTRNKFSLLELDLENFATDLHNLMATLGLKLTLGSM